MDIKATVIKHSLLSTIVMTEHCTFEKIKKNTSLPVGTETVLKPENFKFPGERRKHGMKPFAAAGLVVAALALVVFMVPGLLPGLTQHPTEDNKIFAIIDVDINPCVSFEIDKEARVLSASSLNEDGKILLEELDLLGEDIKDAVAALMAAAKSKEFDASFILISGALDEGGDDEKVLEELLLSILESDKVKDFEILSRAVKVTPEIKSEAEKNGLSLARQAAYNYANREGKGVSLDEIRSIASSDIFVILSTGKSVDEAGKNTAEVIEPAEESKQEPPKPEEPKPDQPKQEQTSGSKAVVSARDTGKGIELTWNKVDGRGFNFYKVVLSKYNSSPAYPEDGYIEVISDVNTTGYTIKAGTWYNGGDFGGKVEAGETYYASITSVYNDKKVKGNSIKIKIPGSKSPEQPKPEQPAEVKAVVSARETSKGVELSWNRVDSWGFNYYKVVLSKYNSSPVYPDDGYIEVISDVNTTGFTVKAGSWYNGGDFGGRVEAGETYYASITSVYNDKKIKGNSVRITVPGQKEPEPPKPEEPAEVKAIVSARETGSGVELSWNRVDSRGFNYYKVVLSKYNSSPVYPDDGYIAVISDANTTGFTIRAGDGYNGGDFGGLVEAGESYYVSITSVYNDKKIKGNSVRITVP